MSQDRRVHLLETALRLYGRNGFHATGIDRILAEAKVAKMTLYKHFKSKDELTLAALQLCDERLRDALEAGVRERSGDPQGRLLAVFDVLESWFESPEYRGCPFIKASAEYSGPDDPIHDAAASHKRYVLDYLLSLAREAGVPRPDELATRLSLLVEGAIVLHQVLGKRDAARDAREAARTLLTEALGGADPRSTGQVPSSATGKPPDSR
jgi:AcrR family transcriptional regulator